LARGIVAVSITHVINYELPPDIGSYYTLKRQNGKTGLNGVCISIVHSRESFQAGNLSEDQPRSSFTGSYTGGAIAGTVLFILWIRINFYRYQPWRLKPITDARKREGVAEA